MRIVARMALAAALSVGMVSATLAQGQGRGGQQPGGRGMGGPGGGDVFGMVANNKALQEELKIDEAGVAKLKDAVKPINEKRAEAMKGFNWMQASEEERKELAAKQAKFAEETKAAVKGVLTADQAKRLTEIGYQAMGPAAFTNKDVQTALKMTEAQIEKVKGLTDALNKDRMEMMREAMTGAGGDRAEMQKAMADVQKKTAAMSKETEEKIAEAMTDDQKKSWKEMIGAKFDTTKLMPQGGRPKKDN